MKSMLKARVSSRGQLALPKKVRDELKLWEGSDLTVRIQGDEVILRKVPPGSWRGWQGRLKGPNLLVELARERRRELNRERNRP